MLDQNKPILTWLVGAVGTLYDENKDERDPNWNTLTADQQQKICDNFADILMQIIGQADLVQEVIEIAYDVIYPNQEYMKLDQRETVVGWSIETVGSLYDEYKEEGNKDWDELSYDQQRQICDIFAINIEMKMEYLELEEVIADAAYNVPYLKKEAD